MQVLTATLATVLTGVPLTPRKPNSCLALPVTACPLQYSTYAGHLVFALAAVLVGTCTDTHVYQPAITDLLASYAAWES
jgi:hypothetical protein